MSILRVILAILFPPLAVIDQGCGSVLIVLREFGTRLFHLSLDKGT